MSAGAPLIHARGADQTIGSLTAVDGVDFDVQRGGFGFAGIAIAIARRRMAGLLLT